MAMKYRPEIDGLRAISVLLVILYHAQIYITDNRVFPGGFIGVDIFFVISGYLITSIIYPEIKSGTFSILAFYERRARRILPALFVVLLCSSLFSWYFLLSHDEVSYAKSLLSTIFFGANVYFWKYTGLYAAEASNSIPLLHLWSLAVEEQFYLIFPPALLLFMRFFHKKQILPILLFITFTSLILSEWASFYAYSANFYLMPTRAWELLGGAILAIYTPSNNAPATSSKKMFCSPWTTGGIIAILYFAICQDDSTRHPSIITAIPILGALSILRFANKHDIVTRTLSSKTFVYIGLLSYSLYLWHQPLFAFFRLTFEKPPSQDEILYILFATLLLSIFSYHFVERPTRNRLSTSNKNIWQVTGFGTIGFVTFSIIIITNTGFPKKDMVPQDIRPLERAEIAKLDFSPTQQPYKFKGNPNGLFTLAIMGDSHMRTLVKPILDRLPSWKYFSTFTPLIVGGTLPILNVERIDLSQKEVATSARGWEEVNELRFNEALKAKNGIIILGGRLPLYVEDEHFDNKEGGKENRSDIPRIATASTDNFTVLNEKGITTKIVFSIQQLLNSGAKVVLVYPIPEVGWNVPRKLHQMTLFKSPSEKKSLLKDAPLTTSYDVFQQRTKKSYTIYDSIPDDPNLIRVFPENALCDTERCYTHDEESLYYYDDDHPSYKGGSMILDLIMKKIDERWIPLTQ